MLKTDNMMKSPQQAIGAAAAAIQDGRPLAAALASPGVTLSSASAVSDTGALPPVPLPPLV
mgnify:CR=1 FL=1